MQTFAMIGKMEAGGSQSRSIIYDDRTVKRLEARYLIEMKGQGSRPDPQDLVEEVAVNVRVGDSGFARLQ